MPLKAEAAKLRQHAEDMQSMANEAAYSAKEVELLRKEVSAAKQSALASQKAAEAAEAQNIALKEAERLANERAEALKDEAKKSNKMFADEFEKKIQTLEASLNSKTEELKESKNTIVILRHRLDEIMHKAEVATAGRDRKQTEINSKEEEICALQVRVREVEGILASYKAENEKFFSVKEKYKATITNLERQVVKLKEEKAQVSMWCNQLISEREQSQQTF